MIVRKHILLLTTLFIVNYSFANEMPNTTTNDDPKGSFAAQRDENQAIPVSSQLKLIPKSRREENKKLAYAIDVSYPALEGTQLTASAEKFNTLMVATVNQEIEQFIKAVKENRPLLQNLSEDLRHNTFHIDYDIDIVKPGDQALISVRFSSEGYQAGSAHPYHLKHVINFDLGSGHVLTLNELFKPHSHYLDSFSKYSYQILNAKLKDKLMIKDGTKPVAKNFKNWNLESDSIVITFDEYQVAPYYLGPQEVEIPLKDLAHLISPKAPIYSCVKDPDSCK